MMEMDRIVSGKRGWVTRGLREYVGKGDRATNFANVWRDRYEPRNLFPNCCCEELLEP